MRTLTKLQNKYKVVAALFDKKAAMQCVDYILEYEADDFYEQAAEHGITKENWQDKWSSMNHIFVQALKAIGKTPDPDEFE